MKTGAAIRPAARTTGIKYAVRDVLLLAEKARAAGKQMIYLNIGDPNQFDFDTPDHVKQAIVEALYSRRNGYAPSSGHPECLEAIRDEADRLGLKGVREVFIGHGASEPIEIALTALVDRGENVLVPSPGYPLYTAILAKLESPLNEYHLDEAKGWQPDPEEIEERIDERTRALVVINPNNPTGSVCRRDTLERIVEVARRHGLVLFADEIYGKLVFDGAEHVPMASLADDVPILTFNGLAKAYFGPGLRIGWAIASGPEARLRAYVDAMLKITRARLCASSPVMMAIPAALRGPHDFLAEAMKKIQKRRDITVERLNAIEGIWCANPGGAFYAFPSLTAQRIDETEFVNSLIAETGVVVVPGSGFGQLSGTRHFRIVFLPPEDLLERAYEAIRSHVSRYS